MISRRAFTLALGLVIVSIASTTAFAASKASATPLTADFSTGLISSAYGVFDDGNPLYENGISKVQCYLGVSGKDLDLVTYNTPRTLHYVFDPSQTAWKLSGIPSNFLAVSDFYGVNYYGRYVDQGIGTTAEVSASIEFYVGRVTYELNYPSLASMRTSQTTWLITSNPNDIPGFPGFYASNQASLVTVRRTSNQTFGTVNMPIRFEINTK